MVIKWAELIEVFGTTVAASAILVGVFSFGVRGMARQANAKSAENSEKEDHSSDAGPVLCFVLSLVIVIYGIYLAAAK